MFNFLLCVNVTEESLWQSFSEVKCVKCVMDRQAIAALNPAIFLLCSLPSAVFVCPTLQETFIQLCFASPLTSKTVLEVSET